MYLFDVLFTIGPREEFLSLTWGGEHAALPYRPMCEHWVEQRHKIFEVLPLPDQRPGGSLVWNGEQLSYLLLPAPEGNAISAAVLERQPGVSLYPGPGSAPLRRADL